MMSGRGDYDGKSVMVLGLTFEEVDHLKANPMTVAISVDGAGVDLPEVHEIRIIVGDDEAALLKFMSPGIDENTVLRGLPDGMKN